MKKSNNRENLNNIENHSSFVIGFFINYLKPSAYVESIEDIDLDVLKSQGIKLIICDLDNTLVPHFTKFPDKKTKDFVENVKLKGFEFLLVSNNSKKRVSFFADKLGLDNYISNAKKPLAREVKKAIKELKVNSQEIVVIGDMIVTDILLANFINSESILVQPLMDNKNTSNKLILFLENLIFRRLSKNNLIVTPSLISKEIYSEDYEIL